MYKEECSTQTSWFLGTMMTSSPATKTMVASSRRMDSKRRILQTSRWSSSKVEELARFSNDNLGDPEVHFDDVGLHLASDGGFHHESKIVGEASWTETSTSTRNGRLRTLLNT